MPILPHLPTLYKLWKTRLKHILHFTISAFTRQREISHMRLGGSVVTCAPLTTTAQVRFQVSCLHPSQPMPSGFPSVAFFWLQIVISPSVMQSIGREKNLVKNPQFTSKCSPDTSGPRLAGEGWGKFSSLEFLLDSLDFWIWAPHLNLTSGFHGQKWKI